MQDPIIIITSISIIIAIITTVIMTPRAGPTRIPYPTFVCETRPLIRGLKVVREREPGERERASERER